MIDSDARHATRGAGVFVSPDHFRVNWHHKPRPRIGGRSRPRSQRNGCLAGDVCVLTAEGYRSIASIKVGDRILSLGNESTLLVSRKVRAIISCAPQPVYKVTTTGASFKATKGHSFLTPHGWVRTYALRRDDFLLSEGGTAHRIVSVLPLPDLESVYNLRTETEHNFIIEGGIVTHNYSFLRRLRTTLDEFIHLCIWPLVANHRPARTFLMRTPR